MKKQLFLLLSTCFALILFSFSAQAEQLRLDFSADIFWSTVDFPDYLEGDTFSGYLLFDSQMQTDWASDLMTEYYSESFAAFPASVYVDQWDTSFDLQHLGIGHPSDPGEGVDMDFTTGYQNAGDQILSFGLSIYNFNYEQPFFDITDGLPSGFDQAAVSNWDVGGVLHIDTGSGWPYADLVFTRLTLGPSSPGLPEFEAPVADPDGNLFLGGDGLPDGARMDADDPDLVTSRTTVGYAGQATFVQTGSSHQTDDLFIGGDRNYWTSLQRSGEYIMTGGELITDSTDVGHDDVGKFTQSGGTHRTRWLMLGNAGSHSSISGSRAEGVGTYNLEGGTLDAYGSYIGGSGQATFNQSGGEHIVGWYEYNLLYSPSYERFQIGAGSSEYNPDDYIIPEAEQPFGKYNLSGGQLTVYGSALVGPGSDYSGYNYGDLGYFNLSGGTASMHNLTIGGSGTSVSGEGHVTVSGTAQLNLSGAMFVGVATNSAPATATVEQTGGQVTADGIIQIGESGTDDRANAYRVRGGETVASRVEVGTDAMSMGRAELEVGYGGILTADVAVKSQGLLMGTDGIIWGNVSLDGGTIAPGLSPGTMIIDGDLILNQGLLQLESLESGEQDLLDVSGIVAFGENAMIELIFDYKPVETVVIEDYFSDGTTLLLALGFDPETAIHFSFMDNVQISDGEMFGYSINGQTYGNPVPLPGAFFLLSAGLLGLVGIRRKINPG